MAASHSVQAQALQAHTPSTGCLHTASYGFPRRSERNGTVRVPSTPPGISAARGCWSCQRPPACPLCYLVSRQLVRQSGSPSSSADPACGQNSAWGQVRAPAAHHTHLPRLWDELCCCRLAVVHVRPPSLVTSTRMMPLPAPLQAYPRTCHHHLTLHKADPGQTRRSSRRPAVPSDHILSLEKSSGRAMWCLPPGPPLSPHLLPKLGAQLRRTGLGQ